MFDKTGTITKGLLEVAKIWMQADVLSPSVILSALGCAETNSEHPIAAAIINYVRDTLGCELTGSTTNFQAVPGCGMKCTVTNLSEMVRNIKNNKEISNFTSLVNAGSSGVFTVNGIQIEVTHSQNMRLGQLIGMSGIQEDVDGIYEVIIGNREWMHRNGFMVSNELDRNMAAEEEQGRSAVLCAINGKVFSMDMLLVKQALTDISDIQYWY
ncbi:hypothetical protein NQ314_018469 [Rhamnusium bicolor]|uniref:Uncharacterized protein n=1 Tax=Rhamnusium bicolor TaxID=1586634 RepID=A0AAV8WQU7_9CUCU|nr:hypothetical protein NQ314_018469 [Rhamnusium bicolor]